ncbi:MAG: hypothetical protein MUF49_04015 [Oculatellaceae cyanobacterium Prado106]|nr:hypothetical protein [Oculatellaceae cyanobacterium Prado106]
MTTIQFTATIKDGVIVIPQEYRNNLVEADSVTVTIQIAKKSKRKIPEIGLMAELARNPIQIKDF